MSDTPSELDDLFDSLDKQQKQQEQAKREEQDARASFAHEFREVLKNHIHRAMMPILEKFRSRRCTALVLNKRKKNSNSLLFLKPFDEPPAYDSQNQLTYQNFENYYIGGFELADGFGIVITVLGNTTLRQVCVFTTHVRFRMGEKTFALKTTEQRFEQEEMVPELFDTLVAGVVKQLFALKAEEDAANQPPDTV